MMPPPQVLQQWQVHFLCVSCVCLQFLVPLGGSLSDLCARLCVCVCVCVRAWVCECVCSAAVCVLWLQFIISDANVSHSRRQSEQREANAKKDPKTWSAMKEEEKTLRNILIKIQCSPKKLSKTCRHSAETRARQDKLCCRSPWVSGADISVPDLNW